LVFLSAVLSAAANTSAETGRFGPAGRHDSAALVATGNLSRAGRAGALSRSTST
jgi:hypothetical protein